jgi:hypothetical protein
MVWDLLSTDARNALLISERYANGEIPWDPEVMATAVIRMCYAPLTIQQHASNAAGWAAAGYWPGAPGERRVNSHYNPEEASRSAAKALASRAAGLAPRGGNPVPVVWQQVWTEAFQKARAHQAELLRDIFPPPGYLAALDPEWRTHTVLGLARQMHAAADYSPLPILADALQDAGCGDEVILHRCRAVSGVHCRGNWVVDLVLDRE